MFFKRYLQVSFKLRIRGACWIFLGVSLVSNNTQPIIWLQTHYEVVLKYQAVWTCSLFTRVLNVMI